MISIPLYLPLFVYLFFLLIFVVFFLVNVWHLAETGTFTFVSFLATFFCLALTTLALWATWQLLQNVGWQEPVTLWNSAWLGSIFSVSPSSF